MSQDTPAQLCMHLLFLSLALPCLGRPPIPLAPPPLLSFSALQSSRRLAKSAGKIRFQDAVALDSNDTL